jgi:hypothetical protein
MLLQAAERSSRGEHENKTGISLGLSLITSCLFLTLLRGFSEPVENRIARIAERVVVGKTRNTENWRE